jgi:pilus assembly protein CpaC
LLGTNRIGSKLLSRLASTVALVLALSPVSLRAQDEISRLDLSVGRSLSIQTPVPVTRVSVASPEIADVNVIGERDLVINGKANGETDILLFGAGTFRRHYRVQVHTPADRPQIVLGVKFAEVRRDFLANVGVSALYRTDNVRAGYGTFNSDAQIDPKTGAVTLLGDRFLSVLTDFGTKDLLALIEAEEQKGRARTLAEPNLMAANRDSATFLAGGEIPIPIAQPGANGGVPTVTIQYREFGIRLTFAPEILNDSLVKLRVRPEVSSLDYSNALLLSGFRVPALRTRRVESSVDVLRDRSLVISGLFSDERQKTRTGLPLLMDIPVLGTLFSSTQWQRNESELVVIVTPIVIDPMHPRAQDSIRLRPETALPAREALEPRLPPATNSPPAPAPRRP